MNGLYYEDLSVGEVHEFDDIQISEEEIIDFGQRYDPLPLHINPEEAADTLVGGLIASGLQTFSLSQRRIVDQLFERARILGSVGFDEVLFPTPVRPGDVLSTSLEVIEKRLSASKPSYGLVTLERTVVNQDDEVVLQAVNNILFERRCEE